MLNNCTNKSHVGTEKERAILFDEIFNNIMKRDSIVPIKESRLNFNTKRDILRLRDEFIGASTDKKLLYAILKINAARKDPHARVFLVKNGLKIEGINVVNEPLRVDHLEVKNVPIKFAVDYSIESNKFLFVADFAKNIGTFTNGVVPKIGDKLISINNIPFDTYFHLVEPYCRYSTYNNLWWNLANKVSKKTHEFPHYIYENDVTYVLEGKNNKQYEITLPYLDSDVSIYWEGYWKNPKDHRYKDFDLLYGTSTYQLYKYNGNKKIILIDWNRFDGKDLMKNMDLLMSYAKKNDLLEYDVIFDGTRSRGGSLGAYAIQRLTSKPFKTTFGNLRISDAVIPFSKKMQKDKEDGKFISAVDGGNWLMEWLNTDLLEAIKQKKEYTNNFPFKMSHMSKDADGILSPAEIHFKGKLVCLFSPHGGSHLDQFAAMVSDNKLAYTIGMPTGGYSKTWQLEETYYLNDSKKPVIRFMNTLGQTTRPNGEFLEGNPPLMTEYVPQSRDNYLNYYEVLLEKAFIYFDKFD